MLSSATHTTPPGTAGTLTWQPFSASPGPSRGQNPGGQAPTEHLSGRRRDKSRLWPSRLASLHSHHTPAHAHMELFAAPQTCHVLPCFLPLRKLLPLPGMSFFTLLQCPFCLGNSCPSFKPQLNPSPQSLLLLPAQQPLLSDPKCPQGNRSCAAW